MDNANLLDWVKAVLSIAPGRWEQLAEALPITLMAERPAPNEWSALDCLAHILDTETIFNLRLEAFMAGRDLPARKPQLEGSQAGPERLPANLAADFKVRRAASLKALEGITPDDLERLARRADLTPVTLKQMLSQWAGHDLMHTVQAERAMMQPFIRDCGPWEVFFKDHVVIKE